MSSQSLSVETRRQIVYSSVLRFAPEAIPLRQRVLQHVVLGALVGSSEASPFRVETLLEHLSLENGQLGLRREVVEDAIAELVLSGRVVEHPSARGRPAYHLPPSTQSQLDATTSEVETLLSSAVQRHFKNLAGLVDDEVAARVFRRFVMECFARFGRTLALGVAGKVSNDKLLRSIDARDAALHALDAESVRRDQCDTLTARCVAFIRSSDPVDERLKFLLAQGYYFTQLLGVEEASFSPLAEHAFSGAVFYLDTNVLIAGLLPSEIDEEMLREVLTIARRIGIELRVTRATIEELHFVVTRRVPELRTILAVVPEEVLAKTNDQIVKAFLHARSVDVTITPDSFLNSLESLETKIKDEWHIAIDERTIDDLVGATDTKAISRVMQEEAVKVRGFEKNPVVLSHDVAHFVLIQNERQTNQLTWFLTRDSSLPTSAERLQSEKMPFCFSQIAMLQSISPYVISASEEHSFIDVFGSMMADQFASAGIVLEVDELMLLAEYHEDVMATPPDQLLMALDYVKSRTLHGRRYTEKEIPQVALELKKFLACDRETQIAALRGEQDRLLAVLKSEQRVRTDAEQTLAAALQHQGDLEMQIGELRNTLRGAEQTGEHRINNLEAQIREQNRRSEATSRKVRLVIAVGGIVGALLVWRNASDFARVVISQDVRLAGAYPWVVIGIRMVGALLFVVPSCRFFATWFVDTNTKVAVSAVTIASALWLSDLMRPTQAGAVANYLALGGAGATLLFCAWVAERQ